MASSKKKQTTKSKKAAAKTTSPAVNKKQETKTQKTAELTTEVVKPGTYIWNKWLAIVFGVQAVAILVVSATKTFPVNLSYITSDPLGLSSSPVSATHHLFDLDLAWLIALCLLSAAVIHTVLATIYRARYDAELAANTNSMRWVGFGIYGSIMAVAVSLICGISDLTSLLMIATLTVVTSLLGHALETRKKADDTLLYGLSCFAGAVSWAVIGTYLISASIFGDGGVPAVAYWAYGTAFILYAGFAANFYLMRKQQGKWADYVYGEKVYMILGLAANSALAWIIFTGILRP